jgi:hypothetical protein
MPVKKPPRPRKMTRKKATAAADKPQPLPRRSVTMQARVDSDFARRLVERDARVLGLDGASDVVREGLRLVHQRALAQEMADGYDDFYAGQPAPLPTGVASASTK